MDESLETLDETPAEAPRKEFHLSEYWAVIVKRRRLIVVCLVLALVAGTLSTVLTKPKYKATVMLDIVRQQPALLSFMGSQGGIGADAEFLPSQMQLMQSREVCERVVRRLNLLGDPGFNPKHFQHYRPDAKGQVKVPPQEDLLDAALDVQGNIDVNNLRGTSLVEVTYTAPTAKLAAEVANAIAESYVDWNADSRFKSLGQSAQFLTSQIGQAKAELDAREKELLAYGRQKEILSSEPQGNPVLQKLDSSSRDLATATADRVGKEARYEEVRNTPPEALAEATGQLAQLRSDQEHLERDYADKLSVYKPEWPAMQQQKAQIEKGRQNIDKILADGAARAISAARAEYLTALRREENLKGMVKVQQSEALAQGGNAVEYRNLRVEIDTKRALLDNLLKQQGETELISRLREEQVTNIRIVDRALPPDAPFKPSYKRYMIASLLLGASLGVGLAFFFSYIDRTLRTPEQVEQHLQLPSLGVIPAIGEVPSRFRAGRWRKGTGGEEAEPKGPDLLPYEDPRSPAAEAYRSLRTALLLSRAGGVKTMVVTSAFPREGKTTTAVNLSIVLAQLGRRVLLVDADMHRARLHEVFRIPNRIGLVSILAEAMEPSRAIVKTNLTGVFVVPSGPGSPNPSALLASDAMRTFLDLAAANFDHVIVDTPPVLPVADTLVVAQYTDGVILCTRAGVTPRDQVARARDRILRSGVPILGVVINALQPDEAGYRSAYDVYGYQSVAAPTDLADEAAEPPAVRTV